jgi:hypothetical protein
VMGVSWRCRHRRCWALAGDGGVVAAGDGGVVVTGEADVTLNMSYSNHP